MDANAFRLWFRACRRCASTFDAPFRADRDGVRFIGAPGVRVVERKGQPPARDTVVGILTDGSRMTGKFSRRCATRTARGYRLRAIADGTWPRLP